MATIKINFTDWEGVARSVDVEEGLSLMEAATQNSVPGIDGDCGGACACATCHVYVDAEWTEKVGGPNEMEAGMLDIAFDVRPNSRLGCQIELTEAHNGLKVTTPRSQF